MKPRVTIVDDDVRFRESLEELLRRTDDFTFVRSFSTADAAIREVESRLERGQSPDWDLVVMDIEMPGIGGIAGTRRLKAIAPQLRVVQLTVFEDPRVILDAICAGVDGYLVKRVPAGELLNKLREVAKGGAPLTGSVARTLLDLVRSSPAAAVPSASVAKPSRLDLTEREQQVLGCLVRGLGYEQAAHELGVSLNTIRNHIRAIYSKLQVHSVGQAVARALRDRLV